MRPQPKILYSCQTRLELVINENFYGGIHYMWCADHLESRAAATVPSAPSSVPFELFKKLNAEITGNDRHGAEIAKKRAGVINGASYKRGDGTISADDASTIVEIARDAQLGSFAPVLVVIPASLVWSRILEVQPSMRANPAVPEYKLVDLRSNEFDQWMLR